MRQPLAPVAAGAVVVVVLVVLLTVIVLLVVVVIIGVVDILVVLPTPSTVLVNVGVVVLPAGQLMPIHGKFTPSPPLPLRLILAPSIVVLPTPTPTPAPAPTPTLIPLDSPTPTEAPAPAPTLTLGTPTLTVAPATPEILTDAPAPPLTPMSVLDCPITIPPPAPAEADTTTQTVTNTCRMLSKLVYIGTSLRSPPSAFAAVEGPQGGKDVREREGMAIDGVEIVGVLRPALTPAPPEIDTLAPAPSDTPMRVEDCPMTTPPSAPAEAETTTQIVTATWAMGSMVV